MTIPHKRAPQVSGFFSCDIDPDKFYAQKVPLYPNQYQRWLVALDKPFGQIDVGSLQSVVVDFLVKVGARAGLVSGVGANFRAVKVLGVSDVKPTTESLADKGGVMKVVEPIPKIHTSPLWSSERTDMLYVAIEFYYDGSSSEGLWPWSARGFNIRCPEDAISGLIAVMRPVATPVPPEGAMDAALKPLESAAIAVDDALKPVLKDLKEKLEVPLGEVGGALKVLLWGGAAVLLFNLFRGTSPPSRV